MLIIYTGNGKGKTSACVGQTIRAYGGGLRVAFAQFMKRSVDAGEQLFLSTLLGEDFIAGGEGFFYSGRKNAPESSETVAAASVTTAAQLKHRDAVLKVLSWAEERVKRLDLLVLDEALYALGAGLLSRQELEGLIKLCRENNTHLVLSGRGLPDWLLAEAELVSEIQELKHPYSQGIKAQVGIEF